jgi:hypothetical protein
MEEKNKKSKQISLKNNGTTQKKSKKENHKLQRTQAHIERGQSNKKN